MFAKRKMRDSFQLLLTQESVNALWLNITEIVCLLNDFFIDDFHAINPIVHNLQPMIESFFIIYHILYGEEEMFYDSKTKTLLKQEDFVISQLASEDKTQEVNPILGMSFSDIKKSKLTMNDMLVIMCEKNKKILNFMIKRNISLLDSTYSILLKKMPRVIDFENKRAYFK